MSWTDERVDLLTRLWNTGMGAGKIAAELGEVTRNAVIGKAGRLKLAPHTRGKTTDMTSKPKRESRSTPFRKPKPALNAHPWKFAARPSTLVDEPEPFVPGAPIVVPVEQRKTLVQLSATDCHFPYGDPRDAGFYFCGGPALPDMPYCRAHCRIAYQPGTARKLERAG